MKTKVAEVMTPGVEAIQSVESLQTAARMMRDRNVGSLLVYTGELLVGILTDRDIAIKATARGLIPFTGKVMRVMTWTSDGCPEDADIEEAAALMKEMSANSLAVMNAAGKPVGVISLSDIAARAHESQAVEHVVDVMAGRLRGLMEEDGWAPTEGAVVADRV